MLLIPYQLALPACHLLLSYPDFVPFTCDVCHKTYCLDHRQYEQHNCTRPQARTVITCPLCHQGITVLPGHNPDVVFAEHEMTCSRSQASASSATSAATPAPTHVSHQCPAPGCRTTLGPSNSVACDRCGQRCCLAHRFPDAHNCPAQAARSGQATGRGLTAALARQQQARAQPRPSSASTPSVASSRASGTSSGRAGRRNLADEVRATAERRRQASRSSAAVGPRATPSGSELCPQCGARFAVVQDLIQHVEAAHGSGPAPRSTQGPPNCTVC